MKGSPKNRPSQLPRRFPVGATYVVEGFGGADGNLRVIARYVVLPSGQRINVRDRDKSGRPVTRALVRSKAAQSAARYKPAHRSA